MIKKKILITGSTGFLGKHFINFLYKFYPDQFIIIESNTQVKNLLNYPDIVHFDNYNLDYIFHFAAITKAGDWCLSHQGEQWLDNQQINTNIIKFWQERNPQATFIGIGTSCSYGYNNSIRAEHNYINDIPEKSLLTYAYTKRMLYLGLDAMNKQYGMNYLYFVPSTLYGTQFTESDNHFIYDVVRKVYDAKYNDKKVEMWGDGLQKRELTWIQDFIKLMCYSIFEADYKNQIINIASGQEHSIEYYYQKICELFDYDYEKVEKNQTKYVGMQSNKIYCSNTMIKNFEFKPIEEGLVELVKYYKALKYE